MDSTTLSHLLQNYDIPVVGVWLLITILCLFGIAGFALIIKGCIDMYVDSRVKELKMEDVKETIPDEVDDLEIAAYVKDSFIKHFPHLIEIISYALETPVSGISWSIVNGDPYQLKLDISHYYMVIKMDPETRRFSILEELGYIRSHQNPTL